MSEKPILYTDPMVIAIEEGRKTQTRRLVKHNESFDKYPELNDSVREALLKLSRYKVGDILWVKQGARQVGHELRDGSGCYRWPKFTDHDKGRRWFEQNCYYTSDRASCRAFENEPQGTLNKLFMPRWASKIDTEVTEVRVQRLHEIGKDGRKAHDVLAEGITRQAIEIEAKWFHPDDSPARAYGHLWESINGKGSWAKNPYVFAYTFKVLEIKQ